MPAPSRPVSIRAPLLSFPNFPSSSPTLWSLYRDCFPNLPHEMLTAQVSCVSVYGRLASASPDGPGTEVGKAGMPPGCGLKCHRCTGLPVWCGQKGALK